MNKRIVTTVLFFLVISQFKGWAKTNVDSLLSVMTLDEKLGQMTQMCFSTITLDGSKTLDLNVDNFRDAVQKYHVGSFLSGSDTYEKWFQFITAIQKLAVEETRLKIPLIIGIDHVHGANYISEGTIFPHNLMLACSFNKKVAAQVAKVTAIETAPVGLSWNFAPVLDVGKNPYWPRLYETFGEDPYLCATMGTTYIENYENRPEIAPVKLSACAKHFIGYSDPKYGYDRSPAEIPMQTLWEHFVPPFKTAFDSGVKTVMINSGELNGEAVHGSKFLLDTLLRQRLGFKGVVVTDIKDIERLVMMHYTSDSQKEGTFRAIDAGIDMYMACNAYDFIRYVKELLSEGRLTQERIDASVRRILQLKYDLGLFENPYPSRDLLEKVDKAKNQSVAQSVAEESIVLMKNEGVLPLERDVKIGIAGIGANSKKMLNGPWSFDWMGAPEELQPADMQTFFGAMVDEFGANYVKHIPVEGLHSDKERKKFICQARKMDVIVLVVGEKPYSEFMGNINDLTMDKDQLDLIDAAISTGKRVIVVLMEGRPRLFAQQAERVDAILFAGYPGIRGAQAITNILSGKVNPSAKLAFTYPFSAGYTIPYYYKPSEFNIYWREDNVRKNLYPFGHGLSYTDFEYSNLQLSDTIIRSLQQTITATVTVKNTGLRDGMESVLWFLKDEIGTITRPNKLLKYFEKSMLKSGEQKTFTFVIKPQEHLAYPDKNGHQIIENGSFIVSVGGMDRVFYLKR